jgi:hypothetical protein
MEIKIKERYAISAKIEQWRKGSVAAFSGERGSNGERETQGVFRRAGFTTAISSYRRATGVQLESGVHWLANKTTMKMSGFKCGDRGSYARKYLFGVQEKRKNYQSESFGVQEKVKEIIIIPSGYGVQALVIPVLPFVLVSRSTLLFRCSGRLSPYQTNSSFEITSLPILTCMVIYFPAECKLFVCSWYSITLHPDHLKAEAVHIDRFIVD